jgi:S1-C subfamily serine protease
VPIDRLPPILAELIADGRAAGPLRPWLGLTTEEIRGRLLVIAVAAGGPAEKAGSKGDVVSGAAERLPAASDFYRKVWASAAPAYRAPRRLARRQGPPPRRPLHEPSRPPQAQVDVLIPGSSAAPECPTGPETAGIGRLR